jgi:DHA2 family methylenomycin A resistance protein-like MFS transporter
VKASAGVSVALLLFAAVLAWRAIESKRVKGHEADHEVDHKVDKALDAVSVKCGTGIRH